MNYEEILRQLKLRRYNREELIELLRRQGAGDFEITHEVAIVEGGLCMRCGAPYLSDGMYYRPTCSCYAQYQRELFIDRILLVSGAPSLYKTEWRRTKYEDEVDKVREYIATKRYKDQWLILLGTTGTGKTRFAVTVMREAVKDQMRVKFIPMVQLINRIIAGEEIQSKGLVVLDDFDKVGSTSEWTRAQVYDLVERIRRDGVGVITSNALSVEELKQKYGLPVSSRILQDALIVRFIGLDMRLKSL